MPHPLTAFEEFPELVFALFPLCRGHLQGVEGLLQELPLQCGRDPLPWVHHAPGDGPLPAVPALDAHKLEDWLVCLIWK